jgi:predicted kinase
MDDKILYLMRGIPGSGKSVVAQMIANGTNGLICSTDDYWLDEDGNYLFDSNRLGDAHKGNQRKVAEAMGRGESSIIVDNMNIQARVLTPYLTLASLFGYTVQVIDVSTDFETASRRNSERPSIRQVPESVLNNMDYNLNQIGRFDISRLLSEIDNS